MGTATTVESLAGTGRAYVLGQMRVRDNSLHIQVPGPEGNREYGQVADLPLGEVDEAVLAWIAGHPASKPSLAGTEAKYVVVQMRARDGRVVHFQFDCGMTKANRSYGAAFDWCPAPGDLHAWVEKVQGGC